MTKEWRFKKDKNNNWELWKDDQKCGKTIWLPALIVDRDIVSKAERMFLERALCTQYHEETKNLPKSFLPITFDLVIEGDTAEKAIKEIEELLNVKDNG